MAQLTNVTKEMNDVMKCDPEIFITLCLQKHTSNDKEFLKLWHDLKAGMTPNETAHQMFDELVNNVKRRLNNEIVVLTTIVRRTTTIYDD